jgi:HEPN domain-containing protein
VAAELQVWVLAQWILITLFAIALLSIIYRTVVGASRRSLSSETATTAPSSKGKIQTYYTTYSSEAEEMLKHAEELLTKGENKQAIETSYKAVQSVLAQLLGKVVQGDANLAITDSLKLLNESGFVTNFQTAVEGLNNARLRSILGRTLSNEQVAAAINLAKLIVASAKEVPFRPRGQA